ncbi:glutamine--fructose-6-phosphate aminotransferase, partial [bacterium]|nr:glutamine--fructose-6-phosphate aminotransferase [bacterium]
MNFKTLSLFTLIKKLSTIEIVIGESLHTAKPNSLIFFPCQPNLLACGISALVAFKGNDIKPGKSNLDKIQKTVPILKKNGLTHEFKSENKTLIKAFLGGDEVLNKLFNTCQELKEENIFSDLFFNQEKKDQLKSIINTFNKLVNDQSAKFKETISNFSSQDVEIISQSIEKLKDINWCLKKEIADNITAIKSLSIQLENSGNTDGLKVFKRLNAV